MRFSLLTVIVAVVVCAAGVGALCNPTSWMEAIVQGMCGWIVLLAAGLSFAGAYKHRFFWRGFAAVSVLYTFSIWMMLSNDGRVQQRLTTQAIDQMFVVMHPRYAEADMLPSHTQNTYLHFNDIAEDLNLARSASYGETLSEQPKEAPLDQAVPPNFYRIARSLFGLLIAGFIGVIAQVISRGEQNESEAN